VDIERAFGDLSRSGRRRSRRDELLSNTRLTFHREVYADPSGVVQRAGQVEERKPESEDGPRCDETPAARAEWRNRAANGASLSGRHLHWRILDAGVQNDLPRSVRLSLPYGQIRPGAHHGSALLVEPASFIPADGIPEIARR
jgi:hypothetical protein